VRSVDRAVAEIKQRESALSAEALGEFKGASSGPNWTCMESCRRSRRPGSGNLRHRRSVARQYIDNYVGLDDGILDCVLEIKGSHKIGKYLPGTLIPVVDESRLLTIRPTLRCFLSWHIADELIEKLRNRGYRAAFLIPLPEPRIV